MNESAGMTCILEWCTRDLWMMRKERKKLIGEGELVRLIHGPRREVLEPTLLVLHM
jgi:hypothetical protein